VTRLGVFGSSFDPPTLGHRILLEEARYALRLDRVIVVPTGRAWHKDVDGATPPATVRLRLAEAAFGGLGWVEVSDAEVRREGPSYSCDTLEAIQSSNPDTQTLLLLGADAALGLAGWHRPDRVLELAKVAVAPRPRVTREAVEAVFGELGRPDRLEFFEMPEVDVSSTLVRRRIASGGPWKHLVPHGAAEMIDNEDLYGREK